MEAGFKGRGIGARRSMKTLESPEKAQILEACIKC